MAVGIDLHLTDDAPRIAVTLEALVESGAVLVAESTPTIVILTLISVTDSCAVPASDVGRAPVALFTPTDSLSVSLTDLIPTLFKSNEGIPIHATDVAAVAVVQPASEIISFGVLDLASLFIPISVTDLLPLSIDDGSNAHAIVQFPVTDSLRLVASDATPTVNTGGSSIASISATESLTLGLTDGPPPEFASILASDTCAVVVAFAGFGEDLSIFAFTPQQFVSVSVVDTCVVEVLTPPGNTTFITASDACAIQAVEPTDNSHAFTAADSLAGLLGDVASVNTGVASAFSLSTTETLALSSSDVASVIKTVFDIALSVTDSSAVQETESVTTSTDFFALSASESARIAATDAAYLPTKVFATTDTAAIQAVEPTDAMAFPSVFDAPVVQATEAAPTIAGSFSFNVNDGLVVSVTETRPAFPQAQTVLTSDSIAAIPAEGGQLVAATVLASEILGITVNDASLLLLKFLVLTDSLGISVTDAATLFNTFIQVAASDTNSVQASDLINFLQQSLTQLATTDSVTIGQSETGLDILAPTAATDSLVLQAQELVDVLRALSVLDLSAYQINSESANIINPFVINSALSVADTVTSDVLDVTGGLPTRLSFSVSDSSVLGLDDVALVENVPVLGTLDFMIETSYKQVNDPQSFQTVSGNFW